MKKIVVALGGNALQAAGKPATAEAQLEVVLETAEHIANIIDKGYEVVVAHGNGPQVGRIVLASETAASVTPAMPFDVCGAMSQGYIGYHIQQGLSKVLKQHGNNAPVVFRGIGAAGAVGIGISGTAGFKMVHNITSIYIRKGEGEFGVTVTADYGDILPVGANDGFDDVKAQAPAVPVSVRLLSSLWKRSNTRGSSPEGIVLPELRTDT